MSYYTWKKTVVYLVIGIIIGYFGRGLIGEGYQDGWLEARDQANGADYNKIVTANEAGEEVIRYQVTGSIVSVDDNKVVMTSDDTSVMSDGRSQRRTVKIADDTVISIKQNVGEDYWYAQVNPELKQELQDLIKKLEDGSLDRAGREEANIRIETINQSLAEQRQILITNLRQQLSTASDEPTKVGLQQRLLAITSNIMVNPLSVNDLRAGDHIIVWSSDDIRYDDKFTVNVVEIQR